MGFSCDIKQGKKSLTAKDFISYKLFGIGPSNSNDTDAPYRIEDMRSMVAECVYGDRLKEAAQDCFRSLQEMARRNLESLHRHHCDTCACPSEVPSGWSVEYINRLLSVDPKTVTSMSGGY